MDRLAPLALRLRAALAVALLSAGLVGSGCATVLRAGGNGLDKVEQVQVKGAAFVLQYEPEDTRAAREILTALETAVPRIQRWGTFTHPMIVRIHPSHEALEQAVRRINYPWLRAWARYDTIDLQSPRTWSLIGATQAQIVELLTHELTHCLMYQRSGTETDWMRKQIPLWFREGMASFTASQGYRRPSDEDLWRYLKNHPQKDPVADADELYQAEADIVYGASHRAFEFLVDRYGESAVAALMAQMHDGSTFPRAFERVVGLPEERFAREYMRYVRWEGWRGRPQARTVNRPLVPVPPQGGAGDAKH